MAIANSYYVARLINLSKPDDRKTMEAVGVIWPNQQSWGTHINVSGGGMLKHAPHKEAARKFLEYLASDQAQAYFANGNNEWLVVNSVKVNNPAPRVAGQLPKMDSLPVGELAKTTAEARRKSTIAPVIAERHESPESMRPAGDRRAFPSRP